MRRKWSNIALFLLGLGASTKIYLLGTIAISELVCFVLAPFVLIFDYNKLRDDGFMPMVWMVGAVVASMFASSWANHTAMPYVVKSFATLYSIFAHFVIFHKYLRNNYRGLGWYVLGGAMSGIITIFYFNPTAMVSEEGVAYVGDLDVENVINGPLFYANKIVPLFKIPISALYLQTPLVYSILVAILAPLVIMQTSVSGRSASLVIFLSGALICIGRKSRANMSKFGRHFFILLLVMFSAVVVGKNIYKYAALNDLLSEGAKEKYEKQTRGKNSTLALLMGGRKEFFAAIPAALDKPILGHGPFARDTAGYWERFYSQFGETEDLKLYYHGWARSGGAVQIPTHSHIMGFWVHYGIGGLIFWIYVFCLIVKHIRKYIVAIPQWYGYFALVLTKFMWDLFFSPFSGRAGFAFMMCCIFFARAIGQGRLQLPYDMEEEARKYD